MYVALLDTLSEASRGRRINVNHAYIADVGSPLQNLATGNRNFKRVFYYSSRDAVGWTKTCALEIVGDGQKVIALTERKVIDRNKVWRYPVEDPRVQADFNRFFYMWLSRRAEPGRALVDRVMQDAMDRVHGDFVARSIRVEVAKTWMRAALRRLSSEIRRLILRRVLW